MQRMLSGNNIRENVRTLVVNYLAQVVKNQLDPRGAGKDAHPIRLWGVQQGLASNVKTSLCPAEKGFSDGIRRDFLQDDFATQCDEEPSGQNIRPRIAEN